MSWATCPSWRGGPSPRHYLMCPPTYFDVSYSINPWMDPSRGVDRPRAELAVVRAGRGLPSARSPGRSARPGPRPARHGLRRQRRDRCSTAGCCRPGSPTRSARAEAAAHAAWHRRNGILYGGGDVQQPIAINEAEGDFAILSRSDPGRARLPHQPGGPSRAGGADRPRGDQPGAGRPAVLPPRRRADRARRHARPPRLLPAGVQRAQPPTAGRALPGRDHRRRGRRVRLRAQLRQRRLATSSSRPAPSICATAIAAAGYRPISIDLSELIKGGGSVKCCTQEIRPRLEDNP